jgi:hypothetical protein
VASTVPTVRAMRLEPFRPYAMGRGDANHAAIERFHRDYPIPLSAEIDGASRKV